MKRAAGAPSRLRHVWGRFWMVLWLGLWSAGWGSLAAFSIYKVHEDWQAVSWWFLLWLFLIWPGIRSMLLGLRLLVLVMTGRVSPRLARRDLRNSMANSIMFLKVGMREV